MPGPRPSPGVRPIAVGRCKHRPAHRRGGFHIRPGRLPQTPILRCRDCRGEHCSPASLTQQRPFGMALPVANGHGRAMPAPTSKVKRARRILHEHTHSPRLDRHSGHAAPHHRRRHGPYRQVAQHAVCRAELHLPPDLHAGDAPQLAGDEGRHRPGRAVYHPRQRRRQARRVGLLPRY